MEPLSASLDSGSFILVNQKAQDAALANSVTSSRPDLQATTTAHPSISQQYTPGSGSSYAHDWSNNTTGGLQLDGRHIVDAWGRVCQLRGVNLSGNAKLPINDDHELFPDSKETVTFVGRPFPLEDAHEHLARLRRWGLSFIRFIVTWEAIEHEGPGQYDTAYLEYVSKLISLFPQYGLTTFISLHQDVWSRYSGGSGAPSWTLTSVGFSIPHLPQAHAAWLSGVKGGGHSEAERGLWPTGYQKLASSTMNTIFWAGDVFTPKLSIGTGENGVPAQKFLQDAFLGAWKALVTAVGHLDAVLGFQMINEPHRGYVDLPSMHSFDYNTDLHLGPIPSAFQGMVLGSGRPASVPVWTRSFPMPTSRTSYTTITPTSSVWSPTGPTSGKCLWEMHGVWGWDPRKSLAVPLRESYFKKNPLTGEKIDWYSDFYWPYLKRWVEAVRSVKGCEKKWVFVEPIPNELCPGTWTEERRFDNMVFAPHWYDLNDLFRKRHGRLAVNVQGLAKGMPVYKTLYWGHRAARECYGLQLRNIVEAAYTNLGERPVVIGECGIPMDMNKGEAFRTDNWEWQEKMMDALITGLDTCLTGFNLWNYNPNNDDVKGDDWNGENFSWFSDSRSRLKSALKTSYLQTNGSLDQGGRILPSIVRPYPAKVAGIPIKFDYEMNTGSFTFSWIVSDSASDSVSATQPSPSIKHPPLGGLVSLRSRESEIFVPSSITRGRTLVVECIPASAWHYDESRQTLFILNHSDEKEDQEPTRKIMVSLDPPLSPRWSMNDFWSEYGTYLIAFLTLVVGVLYRLFFW